MNYYLVVWGSAVESVRIGEGENETVAARYAFGMADLHRMSFKQISLYDCRSDSRRTRHIYNLLLEHAERMEKIGEPEAAARTKASAVSVKQQWERQWAKLKERKHGKSSDHVRR